MRRRAFVGALAMVLLAGCLDRGPLGSHEYTDPPDGATFDVSGSNAEGITITYVDGEPFQGEHVALRGTATMGATPRTLEGEWAPGDSTELWYTHVQFGELRLVWIGSEEDVELATYDVPR